MAREVMATGVGGRAQRWRRPTELPSRLWQGDRQSLGVVVVGASGAGKSSLLVLLRKSLADERGIAFPVRMTTREPRADDASWENATVSLERLDELSAQSMLLLRWEKEIGARAEHYAFEKSQRPVVVLGGNDALLVNSRSIRPDRAILDRLIKVAVTCDPVVRRDRLLRRSPQLRDASDELQVRLSSTPLDVLDRCDAVVDSSDGFDREETAALVELARRLVVGKARVVDDEPDFQTF